MLSKKIIKNFIKQILPPIVYKFLSSFKVAKYGWYGDFHNWETALSNTNGYDDRLIFEKIKQSALLVKKGVKAYERDTVVFDQVEYSWPLLTGLMWIAAQNDGNLDIIDFGGSLGSTYFQNKKFLENLNVKWHIVEQKHYIDYGTKEISDYNLDFYASISDCMKCNRSNTILLSSVLPYLKNPYNLIQEIFEKEFKWVLIDRTYFNNNKRDRITIQNVYPEIYKGNYPCWIFSYIKFVEYINSKYHIICEFQAIGGKIKLNNSESFFENKGFILRRKTIT